MTRWASLVIAAGLSTLADGKTPTNMGKDSARVVYLSDKDVATIFIHPGGSIISFPAKPSKVIVGREGQFDVQYIERDVAVVALSEKSSANMYVYLLGRRFGFSLQVSPGKGERIIMVRDPDADHVNVEIR